MIHDTRSSSIEPGLLFLNICDKQIVEESKYEIEKVMVDFDPTYFMITIENFLSDKVEPVTNLINDH